MDSLALIHWFSGTGNAALLAGIAAGGLERRGVSAALSPIEAPRIDPARRDADIVGIVAPVLGFGLPRNVVSFLRRLAPGRGRRAFVIIAAGNTETIALGSHRWDVPPSEGIAIRQALGLLKRKGYDVIRAEAFEMPTNWILAVNPPPVERAASLSEMSSGKIEAFVDALVRGERYHQRIRPLYAAPLGVVYGLFASIGRRYAGKWFFADASCNGCGQCAAQCPNGTIRLRGKRPVWRWNCLQCFRCINLCPRNSIQVSGLAITAAIAPLLIAGYCGRHTVGALLASQGALAGKAACAILLSAVLAGILHRLQCAPRTGRFIPRWPLTRNRMRYREPGFIPPERSRPA